MREKSEPKIEQGKGVEDAEEKKIEISKSAICAKHLSEGEITKFLPIIKDIRRKDIPEQDKKRWGRKMAIHILLVRFGEILTNNGLTVVEMEEQAEKGEIEFGKTGFEWTMSEENAEENTGKNISEKEQKQLLKIWRVVKIESRGLKRFEPIEIIFAQDEIREIIDKLLSAIKNIDEEKLNQIEQKKETERQKPRRHNIKVVE